jgi:hypothetical protein
VLQLASGTYAACKRKVASILKHRTGESTSGAGACGALVELRVTVERLLLACSLLTRRGSRRVWSCRRCRTGRTTSWWLASGPALCPRQASEWRPAPLPGSRCASIPHCFPASLGQEQRGRLRASCPPPSRGTGGSGPGPAGRAVPCPWPRRTAGDARWRVRGGVDPPLPGFAWAGCGRCARTAR